MLDSNPSARMRSARGFLLPDQPAKEMIFHAIASCVWQSQDERYTLRYMEVGFECKVVRVMMGDTRMADFPASLDKDTALQRAQWWVMSREKQLAEMDAVDFSSKVPELDFIPQPENQR